MTTTKQGEVKWGPRCNLLVGWLIPVFSNTKAMEEIQLLDGSNARKPQASSRLNPLSRQPSIITSSSRSLFRTHLIHNMSIRCCSATLFSLFTFRCRAVKIFRFSTNTSPQALFTSSNGAFAFPASSVAGVSFLRAASSTLGVIAKYSSSSRSTIIACLENNGFCHSGWPASGEG